MNSALLPARSNAEALGRPPLPREHGAWAMLLIPLVTGLVVARHWGLEGPLFLGACLALYIARQPVTMLAKILKEPASQAPARLLAWLGIYLLAGLGFGAPLLFTYGRWLLLPWAALFAAFTVLHIYLRKHKLDRTPAGELTTIAGLALTAPGAYYVAGGLELQALHLWVLTTLYSGASVFYVRMKMRQRALRRPAASFGERLSLGRTSLIYVVALAAVLLSLITFAGAPVLLAIAFLPLVIKIFHAILAGGPDVNIRTIGWTEVAHSVGFTLLLVGAYLAVL